MDLRVLVYVFGTNWTFSSKNNSAEQRDNNSHEGQRSMARGNRAGSAVVWKVLGQ